MPDIDQGQLLASIAATSHDCILSVDTAGVIVWASPATREVLGWPPEELAGEPLAAVYPHEPNEVRSIAVERLLAGERVEPFVDTAVRRDGRTFKAQITLGPVRGSAGEISGVTVILRDVTAQLREQRELALALEASRSRVDQMALPQALLDMRGRLESVNPAWCALFGYDESWFADREILDLVRPADIVDVVLIAGRLEALRKGELESVSYGGAVRHADGRRLPVLLDAAVLREPDGTPCGIAVSARELDHGSTARDVPGPTTLGELLSRRSYDAAVVVDAELTITYVAPAASHLLGYDADDVVNHVGWEYVHPADAPLVADVLQRLLAEPHRQERTVLRMRDGQDRWRWTEVTATNALGDAEVRGIVCNLRDVTEQVRTEEALRLSEALHRAMVETAQEGIIATSPEGTATFANETTAQILGRPVETLYGQDPLRLLGVRGRRSRDEESGRPHEIGYTRPDGAKRILEVTTRPLHSRGHQLGSLVMVSDVTDARRAEHDLRRQALHDPLTGLPNRVLFLDRLKGAESRPDPDRGTAVLFLDLDGFKPINDGYGHDVGDELLREVAARLQGAVRVTDTVGRLGGDEFAILCVDADEEAALLVAHRILRSFAEPMVVRGRAHQLGTSIGVALSPPYHFDQLLRLADRAMYRAKQGGGSAVVVARHD